MKHPPSVLCALHLRIRSSHERRFLRVLGAAVLLVAAAVTVWAIWRGRHDLPGLLGLRDLPETAEDARATRKVFDTVDALYNAYRGWFLDCVRVFSGTVLSFADIQEIKDAKESGRPIVGSFCVYVPEELVLAVDGVHIGHQALLRRARELAAHATRVDRRLADDHRRRLEA